MKPTLIRISSRREKNSLEMLDFICLFIKEYGESPTNQELKLWYEERKKEKIVRYTEVSRYKKALRDSGYITITAKNGWRNIVVIDRYYIDKYKLYSDGTV